MFSETISHIATNDVPADSAWYADGHGLFKSSQLSPYLANIQVKNHLLSFIEEILVLPPFDKLFQDQ